MCCLYEALIMFSHLNLFHRHQESLPDRYVEFDSGTKNIENKLSH